MWQAIHGSIELSPAGHGRPSESARTVRPTQNARTRTRAGLDFTETNDDYFGARYYSSSFGRFLTPDWAATPAPIPYAVMGNPQTLNLYSYVENNPITGTDPDGHADLPAVLEEAAAAAEDVAPALGRFSPVLLMAAAAAELTTAPVEWYYEHKRDVVFRQIAAENKEKEAQKAQKTQSQTEEKKEEPEPKPATDGAKRKNGGTQPPDPEAGKEGADKQTGPDTKKDRSLQGTVDQLKDLERAQKDQNKTRKPIDSTEKSKQNLKKKLKDIHSSEDLKKEEQH